MPVTINGDGSITGLSVGGLPDGIVDTDTLANGAATQAKRTYSTGEIIQTVSTTLTSASTSTLSTNGEITLMSRTYTPTLSSSNALIQVSLHLDLTGSYGGMFINLLRDSTAFARGDAASNRRQVTIAPDLSTSTFGGNLLGFTILDTGISGTSEVTYKVNLLDQSGGGGQYFFNTGRDNSDNNYVLRSVSTLTVMEVAS